MRFNLLPSGAGFYELLEKLSLKVEEGVKLFVVLINAWQSTHPAIQELRNVEHACDHIVHEIMVKLNKTFVTPIDREDIHLLTKQIDDIVDLVHALTERMVLFRIQLVKEELKELTAILEKSVALVVQGVHKIRNLKDSQAIQDLLIQINTFENQGDRAFEKSLGLLFQYEENPIEIIKWKEIYDFVEMGIDKCEDIADIMWGIIAKYG